MIKREEYLKTLIEESENSKIKVLTGLEGVSKSFLLENIFQNHLIKSAINDSLIICLDLKKFVNLNTVEKVIEYLHPCGAKNQYTSAKYDGWFIRK